MGHKSLRLWSLVHILIIFLLHVDVISGENCLWLNGNDLDQNGVYIWGRTLPDDTSWDIQYENFHSNEPNNLAGQNCMGIVLPSGGWWEDTHCTKQSKYICEH